MATRPAKKAKKKTTSAKASARSYQALRKDLMKRLKGVDASILVQVVQLGKVGGPDFFSDWPDSYNRDRWYKTWGKAEAVDPADLRGPIVQPINVAATAKRAVRRKSSKRSKR